MEPKPWTFYSANVTFLPSGRVRIADACDRQLCELELFPRVFIVRNGAVIVGLARSIEEAHSMASTLNDWSIEAFDVRGPR
jgi:hypothetical protein